MNVAILLLASGRGRRMGTATPKVYLELAGKPVIARTLQRLTRVCEGAQVILAVHPEDRTHHLAPLLPRLEELGLTDVVDGGATRQQSMRNALDACRPDRDLILVHDAARPFFPVAAARQAVHRAADVGGAILAIPVPDTLKRVDKEFQVTQTVDRAELWLAQTPQVAQRPLLENAIAHADATDLVVTDDASLLEAIGVPVEVVPSTPRNIKLTVTADLVLAESLAKADDAKAADESPAKTPSKTPAPGDSPR